MRGRIHDIGVLSNLDVALAKYLDHKDDLQAARPPNRQDDHRITVGDLCEEFYHRQVSKFPSGELSQTM